MNDYEYIRKLKKIICKQYVSMRELRDKTCVDDLTGVYNRKFGEKLISDKLFDVNRYGAQFTLIYIDVNHFKSINDGFGHNVGDLVLKKLCKSITSMIRKTDCIIRMGGDEFIVFLNNYRGNILEKIIYMKNKLSELNIHIAAGYSCSVESNNITKLISLADTRMYIDKTNYYTDLDFKPDIDI